MKNYLVHSSLISLQFSNIQNLQKSIGATHRNNLIRELYQLLLNQLDRSCEITFLTLNTVGIFAPEMDLTRAETVSDTVSQEIAELIYDNFDGFQIDINKVVLPIEENQNVKALLDLMIVGETQKV